MCRSCMVAIAVSCQWFLLGNLDADAEAGAGSRRSLSETETIRRRCVNQTPRWRVRSLVQSDPAGPKCGRGSNEIEQFSLQTLTECQEFPGVIKNVHELSSSKGEKLNGLA